MLIWKLEKYFYHNAVNESFYEDYCKIMSSFIIDDTILVNKNKLIVNTAVDPDFKYVLDSEIANHELFTPFQKMTFEVSWILQEVLWKRTVGISLPILEEWRDETWALAHYFKEAVKKWLISDLQYTLFKTILFTWKFYRNKKEYWFKFEKWNSRSNYYRTTKAFVSTYTLEDVLEAEIKQWFISKEIWDIHRDYWYTHLLRQHAEFKTFTWFKNVLINWNKINVVIASRANGKTFDAAYISIRALLNPKKWFWGTRARDIKYFVPNKDQIGSTYFRYCKTLIWDLWHDIPWRKRVFKINESSLTIECLLTWNVLQVVSLHALLQESSKELWESLWEWIACDDAIIDEATRIPNKFWTSFYQRAIFETESFFVISTANEETPIDHWAYQLLIQWELWDPNIASYRVTIDDNELLWTWLPESERVLMRETIKNDMRNKSIEELYAKWYCIIFDKKKIFQVSWNIINLSEWNKNDYRIISLDPAKLDDNAWITIFNVNTQLIERSIKLENADYTYQLEYIKTLKTEFPKNTTVCDRSWVWELLSELDKEWIIDIRIKTSGQWTLSYNKKWYRVLSKWLLIWFLENILKNRQIKIKEDLTWLIEQLNNFERLSSWKSGIILYKWKWKTKDDLVLSLAYAITYVVWILWLSNKEEMKNYWLEFDNSEVYSYNIEEHQVSYNPYY